MDINEINWKDVNNVMRSIGFKLTENQSTEAIIAGKGILNLGKKQA